MNKRTVIANLNKIANELDNSGMFKEATEITNVMKRIAQAQMFGPRIPAVGNRQPQMGNMQLAQTPQPNIQPMADPMFPQAQAPQGTPYSDSEAAVTNAQVAFQGLGNAMSQPQQTNGDTANQMQAMNKMPAPQADAEAKENQMYTQAIQNINKYFSAKDPMSRDLGETLYQNTVNQFKNMQRRGKFMNQVQGLRSKFFPGQSLKPGSY